MEGRKEAICPDMEAGKLRAIHQRLHVRSLKAHFLESLLMDVTSVSGWMLAASRRRRRRLSLYPLSWSPL